MAYLVPDSPGPPPAGGACSRDRGVEIDTEPLVRPVRRGGQGADDEGAPGRQSGKAFPDQVPQSPADSVADDSVANRLGDDETGAGWCGCLLRTSVPRRFRRRDIRQGAGQGQMDDDHAAPDASATTDRRGEISAAPQTLRGGQHDSPRPAADLAASGRQASAPLGATGRDDGAAGAGAHAQPEAVGLRAPAVVRLEGALAHVRLSVVLPLGEGSPGSRLVRGRPSFRSCHDPGRVMIRTMS